MNSESMAIDVAGVGKRYRLKHGGERSLKATVLDRVLGRSGGGRDFWALRDATFKVRQGETLGIIGANGAGKSTMLSLLAGTRKPTRGTIAMHGVVSSLLELGAGFHPDLSGRENVFLAGAIMGLKRDAMQARFDAIVEFSGIADFIEQPVKTYSSGMYVRLGFAVAVEVDPDILLIDEVLAVGDADFQQKCIAKMGEFRERGKTMLIISHDLPTIQSISDRILLLEEGRILGIGDPTDLVDQYEALSLQKRIKSVEREWGSGEITLTGASLTNDTGEEIDTVGYGDPLTVRIDYQVAQDVPDAVFGFSLATEDGHTVYGNNTQIEGAPVPALSKEGAISFRIAAFNLVEGTYLLSLSVHSADHKRNFHRIENRYPVTVKGGKPVDGVCYLPVEWKV